MQESTLRRPAVLADLIPGDLVRDVGLVLGAAGFIGALAQLYVRIPGTPVPVTGQTLGVLLAGTALGWRRAAGAIVVYVALGLAGVPWFAGHAAGGQGPLTGYLVGFLLAALVCGRLAEMRADRRVLSALPTMLVGEICIYAVGLPWLAIDLHFSASETLSKGLQPFLLGEALKIVIAAGLLPATWRLAGPAGRA